MAVSTTFSGVYSTTAPIENGECPRPLEGKQWELMGDTVEGKQKGDYLYGQPVAISNDGTTAVMGTPCCYNGTEAIVDILKFNGINWVEEVSFTGSGNDYFGESISLSGDGKTIAIGKYSYEGGISIGYVEVYHQTDDGTWKQKGRKLVGLNEDDGFGDSVSLSENGNQLAVGAPLSGLNGYDSGGISIYQFNGND